MLGPYRVILSRPGALAFSASGVLARLPMSMVTISIVLLISSAYGEYTLAGVVPAVYQVTQALCSPQLAKLIDRFGQARIMVPALCVAAVGLAGLAYATMVRAPAVWLMVTAVVSGGTVGAMGSLVRARWNHVLDDPRELRVAYSLESALDELVFVTGPVLATVLATQVAPLAGMAVAIVAAVGGGLWFLGQRSTEPPPAGRPAAEHRGSILSPAVIIIALSFVFLGMIFGSSDVATVGYTAELGYQGLAGLVLGAFACGSMISGLLYGTRTFAMAQWKQFVVGMCLLAGGVCLVSLAQNLALLAVLMFATGFTIAPSVINGNTLIQQLVPPSRLTEGLTWVATAIGVGFALGSAVAGRIVDLHGAHSGYLAMAGAGLAAAVTALVGMPVLRARTQERLAPDGPPPSPSAD